MKKFAVVVVLFLCIHAENYTYLTWEQHDIHNHITVHFFSPNKRFPSLLVNYSSDKQQGTQPFVETGIPFIDNVYVRSTVGGSVTKVKNKYQYVYHTTLHNLRAGCEYTFRLHDHSKNFEGKTKKFRTPPLQKIRLIAGGDMGYADTEIVPILQQAAAKAPDVALIGGDIAYANGEKKNLPRWISWFKHWQDNMVSKEGHLIPMILAIGNHEVDRVLLWKQAPFYFGFFFQGGKPYFTRKIGKHATLIVLDTDHIYSYSSQRRWLKKQLQKYNNSTFKIAMYHVPLYPAHRDFDNSDSVTARQLWLPLFDQYNLDIGLEHHDHVFKRSKRLKNNRVVQQGGTIYLGDGSFGRRPRSVEKRYYIEKALQAKHFWFLEIDTNRIFIQAVDDNGKTLDQFTLDKKGENQ
ncbi:metallophosphoesterase [Candidatus Uabimicrobium amorphum]|uniref:Phosphatase n=1 Tax=Uabimicrobium amorphum TaxID=2596890 RepID=A0A5S9IHS2_UABAM|nr:metallophosphoesterase [Candidatus Uabimicrobium amorphum]BBM81790.1 phosphatase [Candidatus Uabimicrobium amorphum]